MPITNVPELLPGHRPSDRILVLGMSPASRNRRRSNGSLMRLDRWMKSASQSEWSFHNVIPTVNGSSSIQDVDPEALYQAVKDKERVIALGGFVSRVCRVHGIDHLRIDHPSPRNRNLNDPAREALNVRMITDYIRP